MKRTFARILLLTLFVAIPFGMRKFVWPLGGEVSEYGSVFLYLADLILLALIVALPRARVRGRIFFLALFAGATILSPALAGFTSLSLLHAVRFLAGLGAWYAVSGGFRERLVTFGDVAWALALAGLFQAGVGTFQFMTGGSAGLRLLGESVITPETAGVARVAADGALFLRAYGTMAHANLLAMFLSLSLLSWGYLFLRAARPLARGFLGGGVFAVLLALALTFSRSGWIAAAIGMAVLIVATFGDSAFRRRALSLFVAILISFVAIGATLGWVLAPRAGFSFSETSVASRIAYMKMGFAIIAANPEGVGIGNARAYAEREGLYAAQGLTSSHEIQPIHNLYLLIGAETGLAGLVLFLLFLVYEARAFLRSRMGRLASRMEILVKGALAGMACALLVMGLFDHFLWTLPAGRLMLWGVLGIISGYVYHQEKGSNPPSSFNG